MSGIVYSGAGDATLGKFGLPLALGAGARIPPGQYWGAAWTALVNGTPVAQPAGYIESDGNATLTASGNVIPLGAGNPSLPWPWPPPWPVGVS